MANISQLEKLHEENKKLKQENNLLKKIILDILQELTKVEEVK